MDQSIDNLPAGMSSLTAPLEILNGPVVEAIDALLDDQHPRKVAAKEWAEEHLGSAPDEFDRDRWQLAAEAGLLALIVPTKKGGLGRTFVESMLTFEGLGAGTSDSGLIYALVSQSFAMQRVLVNQGNPQQLDRWVADLLGGRAIGGFAMSEPDAGSDIGSIQTVATPDTSTDGTWHLHGTKSWVTLGPLADVLVVFASTDTSKGRWGISAFVIETTRPGVSASAPIDRMGLRGAPFGSISLDGVRVTTDDLLGSLGAGASIFASAVDAERALLYAPQLGSTERLLDMCIDRATTHRAGDRPIGGYQAVSHRLADLKLGLEASRLLVYKAAALADLGKPVTLAAALAKLQTTDTAVNGALDAMRVFGAEGYTVDAGVEAELRHAIAGLNFAGTSDIQRNVVAGLLGVDRPRRRVQNDLSLEGDVP